MDRGSPSQGTTAQHAGLPFLSTANPNCSHLRHNTAADSHEDQALVNQVPMRPATKAYHPEAARATSPATELVSEVPLSQGKDLYTSRGTDAGSEYNSNPDGRLEATAVERFRRAARSISERQARFARLRDQAILLRNQCAYERTELYFRRDTVKESVTGAVDALMKLPSNSQVTEWQMHLQLHTRTLEEHQQRMLEQATKVDEIEMALSSVEGQMQAEEEQLFQAFQEANQTIHDLGMDPPQEDIVAAELDVEQHLPGRTEEPADTHPLLQKFYDAMGEAKVLTERLFTLEAEYAAKRAQHRQLEDQEAPAEVSLEDLEEMWARDRVPLESARKQVFDDIEEAREQCFNANLDPDAYKKNLPDQMSVGGSPEQHQQPLSGFEEAAALIEAETSANPGQQIIDEHPSRLHITYKRSVPAEISLRRPDYLEDGQAIQPFEHIEGDVGPDSPVYPSMEYSQNQELVELWRQDMAQQSLTSGASSAAHGGKALPQTSRKKAVSTGSSPQYYAESITRRFAKRDLNRDMDRLSRTSRDYDDLHPKGVRGSQLVVDERPEQQRRRSSDSELSQPPRDVISSLPQALSTIRSMGLSNIRDR